MAVLLSVGVCAHGDSVVTLEEVFATAEANSSQLRASLSAQLEAEREVGVAKAGRLPDITANLSVSYLGDGFTTKRDYSDYAKAEMPHLGTGLSLNVEQPVYTGGALTNGIRLAELKSTASRYATDFERDNIRFHLAGFYLDIYKFNSLKSVVESNLDAARKVLKEMQSRYEQGTSLLNDITRYELLVSNLELQLVNINNTLKILNNNLVTMAGFPDDTVIVPDSTILERSLPLAGEEWWQSEALQNSSSLALAKTGVDINRRAESIVKAERLPKIGLKAGWTMDGPILVEVPPIDRNFSYWYVGVGVSYNLSSLYKSNKSIAKSRAATRRSVDQLDAVMENLSMEVKSTHVRYLEAYEDLKTREKGKELADRNYHVIATRYGEGMALITDLLDATNARLNAEQQLVNARIDIIYYYYKLLFTTGKI